MTSTTNCAACGKKGGNLNTCNKCKMVKYCNAACKKKHRSKHKKQCERRVAELHDEELFKDPPPRDDCPICFLTLPLNSIQTHFQPCCGKLICHGCIYAMFKEAFGSGRREDMGCAFCRKPMATSDEEEVKRIKKLIKNDNFHALNNFAGWYASGVMGMQQDFAKANELYLKAGGLGCAEAYYNLGISYFYGRGVEVDKKKAAHYSELAAMKGDVDSRHNLGCDELDAGNFHRAYKHFMLSAKAGDKESLDQVKVGFMHGFVTKDEYANTLRAYQKAHDEMKSDTRDIAEETATSGAM